MATKNAEACRRYRQKRAAQGLCYRDCSEPVAAGFKQCAQHLAEAAAYRRVWIKKNQAKRREYQQRWRQKLKEKVAHGNSVANS